MASTKRVRILRRIGDPRSGVILAPGATVDLPEFWADRHIENGNAELLDSGKAKAKPEAEAKPTKARPKGKKK